MPRRNFTGSTLVASLPSSVSVPDVGSIIRLIIRIEVVLPQPDGPTKTVSVPSGTSSVRSSTATVPSGYFLVTLSNVINCAVSYFWIGLSKPLSLIHLPAASSGSTPLLPSTSVLSLISASVVSFALTASSTVLSSLDIFCDATSGTTFAARKVFFGSSRTTRWFSSIDGDVLKMLAAVTVPPVRACTVAGPPPSLIATKLTGAMSRPYLSLRPTKPVTRV